MGQWKAAFLFCSVSCWLCLAGQAVAGQLSVPATINASPGDTIVVPVTLRYTAGVVGFVFTLEHSTYLEFIEAEPGPIMRNWGDPAVNAQSTQVTLAGAGATPLDPIGTLTVLRFRVRSDTPNGHVSPLNYTQASFNDGEVPISVQNGTVAVTRTVVLTLIPSNTASPGETFTLDIVADDVSGLLGYLIRLDFVTDDFDVLGVVAGGVPLSAGWGEPIVNLGPGRINIADAGASPLTGPATLASVSLRPHTDVAIGETYDFVFHTAQLNDGEIEAVSNDLMLEITEPDTLPVMHRPAALVVLLVLAGLTLLTYPRGISRVNLSGAHRAPEEQ